MKKYQVNFTDYRNGATSAIDVIEAKDGYTAENYIDDCNCYADQEWCDMLKEGKITLDELDVD